MSMLRRRRAFCPSVSSLEGRLLLTGPSARWIGQDGHDLVSQAFAPVGNGVQDIRFTLEGLPADKTIAWLDVAGLGGGDWQYRGAPNTWAVGMERTPGSTTADLYVDPYQIETGRSFYLSWTYTDGSKADAWATGGTADPNLRMPSAMAQLAWAGQDGTDSVGLGPSVGPDGFQDVHLTIANLSPVAINSVTLTTDSGLAWAFGTNPAGLNNAEMTRHANDPSLGDLWIGSPGDFAGQTLTATIAYANGKTDKATIAAGHSSATLATAATSGPLPVLRGGLSATWIGQDGQNAAGPGSARVVVNGLPAGRTVVAAALSDPARWLWSYKTPAGAGTYFDIWAAPLGVKVTGTSADLSFPPVRDEIGSTLTARFVFDDGSIGIATVVAGTTDVGNRAPLPSTTSVVAHPGDDLNALANAYGTVHLTPGVYDLTTPLTLKNPVAILGQPGATIRFTQAASEPGWSAAIKVHAGHTTLDGFAVRFAAPVRWATGVSYEPAVIGTTDNLDTIGQANLKADLAFTNLDLESPPVPGGGPAVEAPRLIRLASGLDGRIANNTLKGGTVEVLGGPWTIEGNHYLGTVPNTFSWTAFAGHGTHDVIIRNNTAQPTGPSGKTWRFLVLTGTGYNDIVEGNTIVGIGPRDDDPVAENAAEIILTESYILKYEGLMRATSADGLVIQIPTPQNGPAETGDVVAILSGTGAGGYRRVVQALGPQTYLLDAPMPAGAHAISIASGFVNETYRNNTIDARGSVAAGDMIFVGNHYGTTIIGNHMLGGAQSLMVTAAPSEHPVQWGWTHAPFLGAVIAGNRFEDSTRGVTIAVEHTTYIKSNAGRVYFSGSFTDNTIAWTSSFLAARAGSGTPGGIVIGDPGSLDPGELILTTSGNLASAPDGSPTPAFQVNAGTINGQSSRNAMRPLADPPPPFGAPGGVTLVNDTGLSPLDRETTDGRITFAAVSDAVGYEYKISGAASYTPLAKAGAFLATGLVQGSNTILVRAVGTGGKRSADASYQFFLDNASPRDTIPFLRPSDDTGASALDRLTRANPPGFNVTGDPTDTMILMRNGVEVARTIGQGVLIDPSALPDGSYGYSLRRIDAAGNTSQSATVAITIDTIAPSNIAGLSIASNGVVSFQPTGSGDRYEYRIGTSGTFTPLDSRTWFIATGSGPISVRAIDAAGNVGPETLLDRTNGNTKPTPSAPGQTPTKTPLTPAQKRAAALARKKALAKARALARAKALAHARAIAAARRAARN